MSTSEQNPPGQVSLNKAAPAPVVAAPKVPSKARQFAARHADRPLPTLHDVKVNTLWWLIRFFKVIPWLPVILLRELIPISIGIGRTAKSWAAWCSVSEFNTEAKHAEGNKRGDLAKNVDNKRTGRKIVSALLASITTGTGWWLYATHPDWATAAAIGLILVFDAIGRQGRTVNPVVPVALPAVLGSNVPLVQITRSILGALEREGFEEGSVGVAVPLRWEGERQEYRIHLSLQDQLKPEHLRAIERAIGAKNFAIRNLATPTSTVRELVIAVGDPLADPVPRPFIPTGSKSAVDGVTLGVSMTPTPFKVPIAGVHIRIVAGTGGGKTKWILRGLIDGCSACHDVVLGLIDLTQGPEGTLWRDVIQYKGFDVDGAAEVLQRQIDEIERRAQILTDIAEDDDPDNDVDEWHSGLGPYSITVVDEFAQLAAYNGTGPNKDKPNLLAMAEQIVRTGRKHGVSLIMLTQRTGNEDFGSTTMSTQCGVSIAGPCDADDARRMFGLERRAAGYTPHLLAPGVEGDIRDAGKVYIESPMHRTPDIYRAYAPGTTAEVKRRARQRMDDGLPTLERVHADAFTVDAVEVPPLLAAVEQAFRDASDPERMATAELLQRLRAAGTDHDERSLADVLRPFGLRPRDNRWRPTPQSNPVRGYYLEDVQNAIRDLG